jgi:hypothetical protein
MFFEKKMKKILVLTFICTWMQIEAVVKADEAEITFPALLKCCPDDEFFDTKTRWVGSVQ